MRCYCRATPAAARLVQSCPDLSRSTNGSHLARSGIGSRRSLAEVAEGSGDPRLTIEEARNQAGSVGAFLVDCQKLAYITDRRMAMQRLSEQILAHAEGLPEGALVSAKGLLYLGNRAAVDQALSRLAERGQLIRAGRGMYLRPIASRFGARAPSVEQAVEALATQRGEVIVSNGAAAANALGLTTQVPVRSVYLTSGRSRTMSLGKQVVELRHAPRWQLALANRPAGEAVRALAWLGPEVAEAALKTLKRKMPPGAFGELVAAAPQLPTWLARSVGKAAYG
jgi:hypothetical protein